jgi:hypothetical protein
VSSLVLHPRAAPAGDLRVWIGVFDAGAVPPNVTWTLDGAPVAAVPVRPLTPAHRYVSRSFTGVFELTDKVEPGVPHRIVAHAAGSNPAELVVRSVPDAIPSGSWLRILLISCFHQVEDRGGLAVRTFQKIRPAERPDLTLLMGDQVYLDLPTLSDFPDDEAKLAAKFEANYRKNWDRGGGLAGILDAAPSICCPDDHEYWNNFPHSSPIIQNSWTSEGRDRWKSAADQAFDAFQVAAPAQRGHCVEIDIAPLSVIVLDQRSKRSDDCTLTKQGLKQLHKWVDRLIAERKFGAVVTGQSLLDKPVGEFEGTVADWMLPNYRDFPDVVKELARLSEAGRPVLLLTGDVHWGRVTSINKGGRTRFYEIVCSPSALVTNVGSDQLSTLGAGIRAFFGGKPDPWPRHADAPDPEPYFAQPVFGKTYKTRTLHKQKGDQLATLALRQAAGGLEAKVTYYEIHQSPKRPVEISLPLLRDGA